VETVGSGRLRLNRDASIPEVLINGGTVGGTGTLTVTDQPALDQRQHDRRRYHDHPANATMTVDGSGSLSRERHPRRRPNHRELRHDRRGPWEHQRVHVTPADRSQPARGAVRHPHQCEQLPGNTGSTFNNEGTLRKSPGSGNSRLQMRLDNAGEIEIFSGGGVTVTGSATQTGGTTRVDDTTLEVSQGLALQGRCIAGRRHR
jgi:hypothetical protein